MLCFSRRHRVYLSGHARHAEESLRGRQGHPHRDGRSGRGALDFFWWKSFTSHPKTDFENNCTLNPMSSPMAWVCDEYCCKTLLG